MAEDRARGIKGGRFLCGHEAMWGWAMPNFSNLPAFAEQGDIHVVVETPRGRRARAATRRFAP